MPGRNEQFGFDRAGRLQTAVRGDGGLNRLEWSRTYDQAGRPLAETQLFAGQDGGGEPQETTYSSAFSYVIDTTAHTLTMSQTTPAGRTVARTLDKLSRLVGVDGGSGVGAMYTYDRADRRTVSALANGVTGTAEYDVNDRLTRLLTLATPGGATLLDLGYGYDAEGNRLFTRNNTPGLTDRSERYGYDNLNRLTVMQRGVLNAAGTALTTPLNHPKLAREQQWADLDRRGNWRDYRWVDSSSGTPRSRQQTRQVNGVNEYTSIDPDGTPPPGKPPNSQPMPLQHDGAGNLTLDPLARNAGDPCGTGVPTCGSGQQYEFDEENRVTAIKRVSASANGPAGQLLMAFEYDALGRRVHTIEYVDAATGAALSTPRKTRHIYISLETVEEYLIEEGPSADAATLLREFVWGDPRDFPDPVALITHNLGAGLCEPGSNECVFHYLHDVIGSVVALTDSLGSVVERYTYDPYGKTLIEDASGNPLAQSAYGNPFLWTGQRYDAAAGLYGFLYRAYSPELGRWLQRDPLEYAAGSVNLYEYVLGNPLVWIDSLGLEVVFKKCKSATAEDVKKCEKIWECLMKATNPDGSESEAAKDARELSDE